MPNILITGANRGLGLEFTKQYAENGWRVFACSRNPDSSKALLELTAKHSNLISIHPLDVGNFNHQSNNDAGSRPEARRDDGKRFAAY